MVEVWSYSTYKERVLPPQGVFVKLIKPYREWHDLGFRELVRSSRFFTVVTSEHIVSN